MVAMRVDGERWGVELVENPSGVRTQRCTNLVHEEGLAALGAEDKVDEVFCERLWHGIARALSGRAPKYHDQNPGRCPGLSCFGAFSADGRTAASPNVESPDARDLGRERYRLISVP